MSRQHQVITLGDLVLKNYPEKVSENFEKNKALVNKVMFYGSQLKSEYIGILEGPYNAKPLRNEIAGYITSEYNKMQEHLKNPSSYDPQGSHKSPVKKKRFKPRRERE